MSDTKPMALPWKADTFPLANGGPSVKLPRADYEIARTAVNSHAALVEALEESTKLLLAVQFEYPHFYEQAQLNRAALALAKDHKGK